MNIKIVMHSELNCHLKPDFDLIKSANKALLDSGKEFDREKLALCLSEATRAELMMNKEKELASKVKSETDEKERNLLISKKNSISHAIDKHLETSLISLAEAGGGDEYHYKFDLHFNRIVAGLMGSTCYMKDTFEDLQNKSIRNILAIASQVENSGHHSTFGHAHLTLEITGIPKALAMILNNEKEYCTSEKSARYTVMTDIEPTQNALYEKWKEIYQTLIKAKYGDCKPFFDARGVKIGKLAQENARYMISVFTPSNMVYTTSFRELDYLAHWFEAEIANPNSNSFYTGVKKEMQEFVDFVKDNGLYSDKLEDHKDRKLSLFGRGILKENITSEAYTLNYLCSLACLAQAHRHRTIDYRINEFLFENADKQFYMPPILDASGQPLLRREWNADIRKVAEFIPQGTLVSVVENGTADNFILKAMERQCSMAQLEINDLTRVYSGKFYNALGKEIKTADAQIERQKAKANLSAKAQLAIADKGNTLAEVQKMHDTFGKLKDGARCKAGYQCQSPCAFVDGINMERII